MKLILPLKNVNDQDKRALSLYVAIALLGAVCLAFTLVYLPSLSRKPDLERPVTATPKPPVHNR